MLGGRDVRSGGTWLSVNEWGVFAGLTNQPSQAGRDDSRRTRGELPLALTTQPEAQRGVEEFLSRHRPADYNGSWLLAGDRDSLFFIDFTGLVEPVAVALSPGLHVLENRALGAPSPKAERVAAALGRRVRCGGCAHRLTRGARGSHCCRSGRERRSSGSGRARHAAFLGQLRAPRRLRHTFLVPHPLRGDGRRPPRIWVADGPPCTTPFVESAAVDYRPGVYGAAASDNTLPRRQIHFTCDHARRRVPLGGEAQRPVESCGHRLLVGHVEHHEVPRPTAPGPDPVRCIERCDRSPCAGLRPHGAGQSGRGSGRAPRSGRPAASPHCTRAHRRAAATA